MNTKKTYLLRASSLIILGSISLMGLNIAQAGNYSARLKVEPKEFTGKCPKTFRFTGKIKAKKRGRVQYKFIRSDGANAPVRTLDFMKKGEKTVRNSWRLGDPSLQNYKGWQKIRIVYPQQSESGKAEFKLRCRTISHKDLTADIYLVKSARGAPRVPLEVKSGQPLYIQVAGKGKNGVLVNRIGWRAKRTGIPTLDKMHFANSGDRPADARTWSAGSIRQPGRYKFCGFAWGKRGERAKRCIWVTVKSKGSKPQVARTGRITMTGMRSHGQSTTLRTSGITMTGMREY